MEEIKLDILDKPCEQAAYIRIPISRTLGFLETPDYSKQFWFSLDSTSQPFHPRLLEAIFVFLG